jgi:hypothetical protein
VLFGHSSLLLGVGLARHDGPLEPCSGDRLTAVAVARMLLSVAAVLRRQLTGPVRYEPADRLWFAALSVLIPRRRWAPAPRHRAGAGRLG